MKSSYVGFMFVILTTISTTIATTTTPHWVTKTTIPTTHLWSSSSISNPSTLSTTPHWATTTTLTTLLTTFTPGKEVYMHLGI